jgi:acetoin utilization protein AcuB
MQEPPHVREFMTTMPQTIGVRASLAEARRTMAERGVRHLPVVNDGILVGILSEREIALCEALKKDPDAVEVETAMRGRVFTCGPEAHLHAVAEIMADEKYGSAVIVERDHPVKVLGVFTTVDALRALARYTKED